MTMSRTALKIQFLEKIGAPLMCAALSDIAEDGAENAKSEAQKVASLLAKSVEFSGQLADLVDLKGADEDVESMRLALAAVSGNLLAFHYKKTQKIPGESAVKKLTAACEAVLLFSDNYTAAVDNAARLEAMKPGSAAADENQVTVQYMSVMVPVIGVVANFAFGQDEKKLIQEIADKLMNEAEVLASQICGAETDKGVLKRAEFQLLDALSALYVECHQVETDKLLKLDEAEQAKRAEQGDTSSMNSVWELFASRLAMLKILTGEKGGAVEISEAEAAPAAKVEPVAPPQPQQEAPAPVTQNEEPSAPAEESASTPDAQEQPESKEGGEQEEGDGNPMSFFTKKPPAGSGGGDA